MRTESHHAGDGIVLSSAVMDHLQQLPASALKVYIYLCSCSQARPIAASVTVICAATGLKSRASVAALKVLRDRKLISCKPGMGDQPNEYHILFSPSVPALTPEPSPIQDAVALAPTAKKHSPPTLPPQERTALPEPIATVYRELETFARGNGNRPNEGDTPFSAVVPSADVEPPATQEITTIPQPAEEPPRTTGVPQEKATLPELIAQCFRRLGAQEFAQLKVCFPDEAILAEKLKSLKSRGNSVAPDLGLGFLVAALEQYA